LPVPIDLEVRKLLEKRPAGVTLSAFSCDCRPDSGAIALA
jgi:hypothetical protein